VASGFPTFGGNQPGSTNWNYAQQHWNQVQSVRALLLLAGAWDQPRGANWDLTDYNALVWYQQQEGIAADGVVGTVTYNHLLSLA